MAVKDPKNNPSLLNTHSGIDGIMTQPDPAVVKNATNRGPIRSELRVKDCYHPSELARLPGGTKAEKRSEFSSAAVLRTFVDSITSKLEKSNKINATLMAVHPSLKKAKAIYAASVMSPNDMQTDSVTMSFESTTDDVSLVKEVNQYLTNLFNDDLKFGEKLTKWVGEYTYEKGSKPVMILPRVNVTYLMKHLDQIEHRVTTEADYAVVTEAAQSLRDDFEFYRADTCIATEADTHGASFENLMADIEKEAFVALEALVITKPVNDSSGRTITKEIIRDLSKNIINHVQTSGISLSKDIGRLAKNKTAKEAVKILRDSEYKMRLSSALDGTGYNILHLTDEDHPDNTRAILMSLPDDAVAPLVFPGDEENHQSYIVALDRWGNPISMFKNIGGLVDETDEMATNSAIAMFGTGTSLPEHLTMEQKYAIIEALFSIVMKNLLLSKGNKEGLVDVTLDNYEVISKCLFHQALNKTRVTLLCVPPELLVYYCDDYNHDGTGKNKLSDVQFLLTVKAILMVAYVMAAARGCIDVDLLEITFDDKDMNYEQTLELARKILSAKKAMDFNVGNPNMISRNIADASVGISPKNIPGLEGFEISRSKDTSRNDHKAIDSDLLEIIDEMCIESQVVPSAAISAFREAEFATGLVTQNVMYRNEIRTTHKNLRALNHKFVRSYIRYSLDIQKDLVEIYRKHQGNNPDKPISLENSSINAASGNGQIVSTSNGEDAGTYKTNEQVYTAAERSFVSRVMHNSYVVLPTPQVALSNNQVTLLEAEMGLADKMLEIAFADDLVFSESGPNKDVIKSLKAHVRRRIMEQVMQASSAHLAMSIPNMEDVSAYDLAMTNVSMLSKATGISKFEEMIKAKQEAAGNEEESSSGSAWD